LIHKHYIVLLDRQRIPGELRIPDFDHVWVEYPGTAPGEVVDHLWRATIGVSCAVPISRAELDGCVKLQTLIVTDAGSDLIDLAACAERAIEVLHLPPEGCGSQALAGTLVDLIEAVARR
jgi:glycerate dehydrogenase